MHPTIHITAEAVNRRSPIWLRWLQSSRTNSAADPGFPRGGGANSPWGGGRQHTILSNFPKNCMKLNEFGPGGGHASLAPPLDPPLQLYVLHLFIFIQISLYQVSFWCPKKSNN